MRAATVKWQLRSGSADRLCRRGKYIPRNRAVRRIEGGAVRLRARCRGACRSTTRRGRRNRSPGRGRATVRLMARRGNVRACARLYRTRRGKIQVGARLAAKRQGPVGASPCLGAKRRGKVRGRCLRICWRCRCGCGRRMGVLGIGSSRMSHCGHFCSKRRMRFWMRWRAGIRPSLRLSSVICCCRLCFIR